MTVRAGDGAAERLAQWASNETVSSRAHRPVYANPGELKDDVLGLLSRVSQLTDALRLQTSWHTFEDGKFCDDDCPKCARDAALEGVPVTDTEEGT